MILSSPFNQTEFTAFIESFLPDFKLDSRKVDVGNSGFLNVLRLGESTSLMTSVLVVRSKLSVNSRIALTNNSFKILKIHNIYRALVVYVNDDDSIWRLSLLSAIPVFDSSGKVVVSYSNPRRHSYVLGSEVGIATARKYLSSMGRVTDFENLKLRFSVEAVNRDFYKEIAEHFYNLVGRYGERKEVLKGPALKLPSIDTKLEDLQNYSVRLLGRIIFLWFLKQKTSNAGKPLLPHDLLAEDGDRQRNILHGKVEPVFFEVLNKPHAKRDPKFQAGSYGQVPYLNGGLFHASDGPAGDFYSAISKNSAVEIPDEWFISLFKTLDAYNFTIDENLEHDVELSIDPEMLGRVFENLLAEINPETGQVARRTTGSYYTPRPIVNFMVDESLTEYLLTKTSASEDKIRAVITVAKHDDLEHPLNEMERKQIVDAISQLKVLDPACGSGAFPIGMLQKILWVITQVDPDGNEYLESHDLEGTEHWLTPSRLDYLRKRKIIRDVIFGTDIQSVAVEIAKLRCFLTLIVDQEIDDKSPNRGVVPLPNLDFKFICADSLTPLDTNRQMTLGDDPQLEEKLASIRRKYFTTSSEEKKSKLRQDFENLVNSSPTLFTENNRNSQLKSFRPLASNNQAKFFDLQTMFGLEAFPIIIGNPPYKVLEGPDSKETLENLRRIKSYIYATGGKLNLYRHFIERSQQLLSADGVLCFIVPSTLIADKNTQGIRLSFKERGSLKFLIEFPEKEKVFESVTQATTVFLFKLGAKSDSFKLSVGLNSAVLPPQSSASIRWKDVKDLFGESLTFPLIKSEYELTIMKSIREGSEPLAKYFKCYQGDVNLGTHKSSLRNTPTEFLLVRGEHIQAYSVDLSERNSDRRWFESKESLAGVSKSRVVSQGIANMGLRKRLIAAVIPENVVVGHSANCFEQLDEGMTKNSLVALLNSNLMNWYYKKLSTNNNVNIYEMDELPIRKFSSSQSKTVDQIVHQLTEIKKLDSGESHADLVLLQRKLDTIVYDLFELSGEFRASIEDDMSV